MIEVFSIPVIKIALFLAALYAPGDATEMEIHFDGRTMTFAEDRGVWVCSEGTYDDFTIKGFRLLTPAGFTDLETELENLRDHSWSSESVLKVGTEIEVLKTTDGFLIFPEGIRGSQEPIRIVYTVEDTIRRKVTVPREVQ